MTKTRREIDAALKAKIALETVREQATVADLPSAPFPVRLRRPRSQEGFAQRYAAHPNPIYA